MIFLDDYLFTWSVANASTLCYPFTQAHFVAPHSSLNYRLVVAEQLLDWY